MQDQVPNFDKKAIKDIVKEHYGIEGEIKPLVSYEDQNARINTGDAKYVLKISNKKWSLNYVKMQTEVLDHLKNTDPGLTFPSVVKAVNGESIVFVDGFAVRLLTYLEGDLLTNITRTPELYRDVGRFLGQFSKAMQSYSPPPDSDGSDKFWKLDNVIACKEYLPDVIDEDARDRIARLFKIYEHKIAPRLPSFRKAVIHSDANEQNFLINPAYPTKIAGLIDFGEMQIASQVNDLAITLAYALLGENDIDMAAREIIAGYENEFPLEDQERDVLYYLMAMRLVTNITMTSHTAKQQPDNEYILIAQGPARALLKQLEEQNYIQL
jgi:Ser/Thr protein kinase RdoA (MazF antagonist)